MKIGNIQALSKETVWTCGMCIFFHREKCPFWRKSDSISLIQASDHACVDGICILFIGANVIIAKTKTRIVKPIRFISSEKAKSQILRDLELEDYAEVENIVIEILERKRQLTERKVAEPKAEEQKEFLPEYKEKALELLKQSDILEKFIQHSNKWLVEDVQLRKLELLAMISALSTFPLNLSLQQTWSSGKSTTTTATAKYFQEEDTWLLGAMSPKALIHMHGTFDKEKDSFIINLEKKILVFLDEPTFQTLVALKPLLSRDRYESQYKYVDSTTMKTVTSTLRGFPTAVFCAVKSKYTEEFTSRWLTASPSTNPTKIRKVLQQKADKKVSPEKYEEDTEFLIWKKAFAILKEDFPFRVVIPYAKQLEPFFRAKRAVDMRFFDLFLSLIEATTILYSHQRRKNEKERIIATIQDYQTAYEVFKESERTTVYGVGQDVLDFYTNIVLPCTTDNVLATYQDLASRYYEMYQEPINQNHMRDHYLRPLEAKGLIEVSEDTADKRRKLITSSGSLPEISLIDNEGFMKEMEK